MSIFGSLFGTDDNQGNQNNNRNRNNDKETDEGTLQLRKEELDINKNKVQTGEVILSKEVVEEQQSVNVPVTHEEVVIERRPVNSQTTDSQISSVSSDSGSAWGSGSTCDTDLGSSETIRIPVTEEKVNVGKHTVVTEEVSAHKRDVEQTQEIQETLRREEARIDKNGNPVITNEGSSSSGDASANDDTSSGNNPSNSWFK